MTYRRLFFFYSFILILLVSRSIRADHAEGTPSASPSASPTASERPVATSGIRDKEVTLLSKVFQTSEDFIKNKYSARLPLAVDKITSGSEDEIATVAAELMGMVNDKQLEELIKEVEKQMKAEGASSDSRYMDLLNRLKWAKEILKPTITPDTPVPMCCSDPAFAKFKEAFMKAWGKTKEHNDEFYTKLDKALNGVGQEKDEAKEFLRTHYDSKALLGFIEAQRDSGNAKLANDLTRALSFTNEEGGHYIDAFGLNSSKDRIHLGKDPEKLASGLKDFSEKSKTPLRGMVFSDKKFAKPDREFREGAAVRPVATPTPTPIPTPKPTPKPVVPPPPTDDVAAKEKAAQEIIKNRCVACHGPTGKNKDDFAVNTDGTLPNGKADIENVVRRAVKGEGGFMPNRSGGGKLLPDQIKALSDWAKLKGVEID